MDGLVSSSSNILINPRDGRELNHVTFHDSVHDQFVIVNNANEIHAHAPDGNTINLSNLSVHHSPSSVPSFNHHAHHHLAHAHMESSVYSPSFERHSNCNYSSLSRDYASEKIGANVGVHLDLIETPLQIQIDNNSIAQNHNAIQNHNAQNHNFENGSNLASDYGEIQNNQMATLINTADMITSHFNESYHNDHSFSQDANHLALNYETLRRRQSGILSMNQSSLTSSNNSNPSSSAPSSVTSSQTNAKSVKGSSVHNQSSASKPSVSFANNCSYIPNESTLDS